MFPREHGAYSMLAQPFLCALIIAGSRSWSWHWSVVPAAVAAISMFLLRGPLVVLARQRWVWRQPHAETAVATRWALGLGAMLAVAAGTLSLRWPPGILAVFGAAAGSVTAAAVAMTVRNRQRSVWLQLASASGLTASCLAASLSTTGTIPEWRWWLWSLSAAHSSAAILTVHARLEQRIASRTGWGDGPTFQRPALLAQFALLAAAPVAFQRAWPLGAALAMSAAAHLWELRSLKQPGSLQTPLRTVGFRALAVSVAVSVLLVIGLRK